MKSYYYNSKTQDLSVLDTETKELLLLEHITSGDGDPSSEMNESTTTFRERGKKKRHYKRRKIKRIMATRAPRHHRKQRTCKNCGKPGHMAKTCPELRPSSGFDGEERGEKKHCFSCESGEHNTRECPELGTTIGKLQEKGMSSLRVAQRLHLPLRAVNEHWDGSKAAQDDTEDDGLI